MPSSPLEEIAKLATGDWNNLLAFTSQEISSLPDASTIELSTVESVYEAVDSLDDSKLDALYSFGLRPITAGIALALENSDVRQAVSTTTAERLVRFWQMNSHNDPDHARLRVADLGLTIYDDPIRPLAREASNALPPEWRMLADVLVIANGERRTVQTERSDMKFDLAYRLPAPPYRFQEVIDGTPAAVTVGQNGTAGSFAVVRRVLDKAYEHANPADYKELAGKRNSTPILAEAFRAATWMEMELGKLGLRCAASFRLDKFQEGLQNCVSIDKNGKAQFLRGNVVPARDLGPPKPASG